jgi:hypothetical protein
MATALSTERRPPPLPLRRPIGDRSEGAAAILQCAFCSEPLPFTAMGVEAWRVDDRYFCNEFCAAGAE